MGRFSQNVKHQPTKMSISVSGRVAKCVTNADATAAATAVPLARLPITQPPKIHKSIVSAQPVIRTQWF